MLIPDRQSICHYLVMELRYLFSGLADPRTVASRAKTFLSDP